MKTTSKLSIILISAFFTTGCVSDILGIASARQMNILIEDTNESRRSFVKESLKTREMIQKQIIAEVSSSKVPIHANITIQELSDQLHKNAGTKIQLKSTSGVIVPLSVKNTIWTTKIKVAQGEYAVGYLIDIALEALNSSQVSKFSIYWEARQLYLCH